ncbi:hypothetical protein HMPREF9628_01808 [Peptoanaerobacter stomatis]|uniref:Uncharacterized protein n=1 Tax=Peptoanaerobacter stomatis TaxID=796937 RepID=G9XDD5_9FIRM|nr:hypothetical protein HMPREF9628_01808 [Peptoanaerobacter stomatis]
MYRKCWIWQKKLREQGFDISDDILTIDDIKLEILKNLKEK